VALGHDPPRPDSAIDADVSDVAGPTIGTVDLLARLTLAARHGGGELRIVGASDELHELLELAGLCDVLGVCEPSGLEAWGEAEEREEAGGVEEEDQPGHPVA
jgi:hypothetical protein